MSAHIQSAQRTTERPILFTTDMVRAILEGRKTQTRRIIKHKNLQAFPDQWKAMHQDGGGNWVAWSINSPAAAEFTKKAYPNGEGIPCSYGQPGDRLLVRETWAHAPAPNGSCYIYKADFKTSAGLIWRPSIHMPRAASRITLQITDVRAQRLHHITEADAIAEGVEQGNDWWRDYNHNGPTYAAITARHSYRTLWEKINGPGSWEQNPWVWAISFKKIG